ncbi:MAG: hypothetical protein ACXADA_04780 [Candidatus Hodarchaeales archaeon]
MTSESNQEINEYFKEFYNTIDEEKQYPSQGDIFIPPFLQLEENCLGYIIISNSCDIINKTLRYITFLPIYQIEESITSINSKKRWKRAIKLNHTIFFYLPPYESLIRGRGAYIAYQNLRSIRFKDFLEFTEGKSPQITLSTPFRDKLNASVSRLFNRIPIDHPEDEEIEELLETDIWTE